jgi:predicted PurR-regulated permease PerM
LLIAVLDVLPVLGSGGVLVPWGIVAMLMGDPMQGIGMFVLWGVIVVVRQVVEPKIVGSQIGLHPLITIAALFLGLKLMGGLGLIVAPLYIIVCKKLNEEGVIHLYKNAEPDHGVKESSNVDPTENK